MNEADSVLIFSVLFERALAFWPESIDLTKLRVDRARPDLYVVLGLGELSDSIAEEFGSQFDAVIMTSIHDAISSTIRSAALYCTEIKLTSLRSSTVRENLEKRLRRAETNKNLGWSDLDIELVKRYFSENLNL
ncbi:hypothetical protein [Janthinobacterium agaricidamnosum]|uniref:hypothetical protein n=1 Tax=Janthinobacterium agaricidamnosum TaxID=55508 RepID=UPI000AFCE887|nr:hypothetical protein [Janthinobacterium agaricidamnosum]